MANEESGHNDPNKEVAVDQPTISTATITNTEEAEALKKILTVAPATQAMEFITQITQIRDSGMYENYYQKHEALVKQLSEANDQMPDAAREPSFWEKCVLWIPFVGKAIRKGIKKTQFSQADSITQVQKLLFKLDESYASLRLEIQPTRELRDTLSGEVAKMHDQIKTLKEFVANNTLSPEASEFMEKYIATQIMSVEEMEHTFVPWLQEVINHSERLYLSYIVERKAIATSLITTVKILQRVNVVQIAADSITVMRDVNQKTKLVAAKAMANMRKSVAEVEGSLMYKLESFTEVKGIDDKSVADAKVIKAKGKAEMQELLKQAQNLRMETTGDLNQVKLLLPGGEELTAGIKNEPNTK